MNRNEANRKSCARLQALASRLNDEQLTLPAGDGWTAAALLAHLAFWDYRAQGLMLRWKKSGVSPSPLDSDNINDAMLPLLQAIPGREAARLAIQAAEAVDAEIEQFPEDLIAGIDVLVQEGKFRLNRSIHRDMHLDQIEKALVNEKIDGM